MSQNRQKQRAAAAALEFVPRDAVIGVGTGSTVNFFIDGLAGLRERIAGAVSSSEASSHRLRSIGVPLLELNEVGELPLYVDGADEATRRLELLKGGGGALTREKIVAAASRKFVCIVDEHKLVGRLGSFPLPVEVIPMARSYVSRELAALGGRPLWREGTVTDNGNHIIDVAGLEIVDAASLEQSINQIAGVVTVGLFAQRPADLLLVGTESDVVTLTRGD
ncbi:MAG TPA: ribose-5-phosphate isomerase RpiA [Steroidobacteraceae bacterium]|nr:ribose-5-phosphate isomerase RpiA [Steroidobacteraceae bacterium]